MGSIGPATGGSKKNFSATIPGTNFSNNSDIQQQQHYKSYYPSPPLEQFTKCIESNYIRPTSPVVDVSGGEAANSHPPFSIRQTKDFERHHSRECQTSDELLRAIRDGHRVWDATNMSLLQRERLPSTFVPFGCDIPISSSDDMCETLNRFSDVVILGDSMGRHVQQGVLMNLRNDVVRGGIQSSSPDMRLLCLCDGQFSEHYRCRMNDGYFYRFQPHELKLCPKVLLANSTSEATRRASTFTQHYWKLEKGVLVDREKMHLDAINCSLPSYRGLLLYTQSVRYKPFQVMKGFLNHVLKHAAIRQCAKLNKLILVWSSYTAQSPLLDDKFQSQTMSKGLAFNEAMSNRLRSKGNNIPILEWVNFTVGAQSIDGFHFSANINYFKAQHIVALAKLMLDENKTTQLL